jgi:hypothetical protein
MAQSPGVEGERTVLFGNRVPLSHAFTASKLLPALPMEADRLGVFGGTVAQPLYGIEGKPVSWRIPIPGYEKADTAARIQPPGGERLVRYLVGMRPYEVELWREGRRRLMMDNKAAQELGVKIKNSGSNQDKQRMLGERVRLVDRMNETLKAYTDAGIKIKAPNEPLEGYQ